MKVRRVAMVLAVVGSSLFLAAPTANAQECADDDHSASCQSQRECERRQAQFERLGLHLISCTQ